MECPSFWLLFQILKVERCRVALDFGLDIYKECLSSVGNPIVRGAWGDVVWAVESSGKSRARDFYRGLKKEDRAKLYTVLKALAEHGHVSSRERFKKLGDFQGLALWEIKSFQLRLIGAYSSTGEFVVAHGLRKKRDQHRRSDLEVAVRILNNHFEERFNGT